MEDEGLISRSFKIWRWFSLPIVDFSLDSIDIVASSGVSGMY